MVETVVGVARAAPQVKGKDVDPLSSNVAQVAARVDLGTVCLAICTGLDSVVDSVVRGIRGLDVEADEIVGWRLGKGVLSQDVGDWSTLVIIVGKLAGRNSHDGDGEEKSSNCGEMHGG